MDNVATILRYSEFGAPDQVIGKFEEPIPQPNAGEVLVKVLAAPINPADLIMVSGKYSIKPLLPAIPGNECVAEVLTLGADVTQFSVGDHVVPLTTGLGTWRSHAVFKATDLMAVPKSVGIVDAAALTVNPCTSYRMLKDFVDVQPGDTVIQNGANSSCGQYAIQLCRAWNVNCIGVVRNRPDIDELKQVLKEMGAAEVLTEEELHTTTIFETGQYKAPRLALNCVGGQSATELWRRLDNHGTMVTYGEKSGQPVTAPVTALIYKDIRFCGFWMTRWRKTQAPDSPLRKAMFDDLIGLIESGQLKPPVHELIPVANYKDAFARAANSRGFLGTKCILKF